MKSSSASILLAAAALVCLPFAARAQAAAPIIDGASSSAAAQAQTQSNLVDVTPTIAKRPGEFSVKPFSKLAIAASFSTQGIGAEAAVPLSRRFNLRGGTDFFDYNTTLTQDNVNYSPAIDMMSSHVVLDWYPFHGHFRVSGGYMFLNGSNVSATAGIPAYQSFTMDSVTYYSSATDPLKGGANVNWPSSGPRFTIGWGNMIPRTHSHISIPTEIGFAYFGDGTALLHFSGTACQNQTAQTPAGQSNCASTTSNLYNFSSNLAGEQAKLQNDITTYARFWPILKVGISYKF